MNLEEQFERYCIGTGDQWTARVNFFTGAAAMAEQFAAGCGPTLEVLKEIRDEIAKANQLAEPRTGRIGGGGSRE